METDFTCSYLFSVATRNVKVLTRLALYSYWPALRGRLSITRTCEAVLEMPRIPFLLLR